MLNHLVHQDGPALGDLDERAHAIIDGLTELTEWQKFRISEIRLSGSEALVQLSERYISAQGLG